MKTPLYYYVVAAFSSLFGDGLLAGRLVSLLATVGVALFVWLFVRREGGTRLWAAFGVGLFLATYHIARDWYDIARLDSFFLLLTMGAAYCLRFAPRMRGAILAGLLFAAAFFTKQAVLMLMIPALLFYAFAARRRVLAASLVAATVIVLGMLALHVATGGWSSFFLIEVPRHVVIESDAAVTQFWISDMLAPLGVALIVSIAWIASLWRTDRGAALFYAGLLGGALLIGWAGRANVAGSTNVLMPVYAAFAITMPLGLARVLRACSSGGGVKRAGCVGVNLLALLQLGLLFYDPRQAIPSAADRALSDAILARLRAVDGAILTTDDRFFAKRLSNGSVGLDYSLIDLVNDRGSAVSAQFQDSIIDALRAGRFVGVVDPPDFLRDKVSFGAPLVLQSTPPERRNRFTPRMQLYYPVAR